MVQSRKLLAIMFTDIVGYTSMSSANESSSIALVETVNLSLQRLIKAQQGNWIKTMGDGTLSTFTSAYDALVCAVKIQQAYSDHPQIKLRIGIHIGDIVEKGSDVLGSGVNIAARIEGFAQTGEIVVSNSVKESLSSHPEFSFTSLGIHQFKGVERTIEVFSVAAEDTLILESSAQEQEEISQPSWLNRIVATAMICLLLVLSYQYWRVPSEKISFATQGFDTSNEKHSHLLHELVRNLTNATNLPVTLNDTSPTRLRISDGEITLQINNSDVVYSSLNDAFMQLHDISLKIYNAQPDVSETSKQNLALYIDAYKELEGEKTLNSIDNLVTKISALLVLAPQNINYLSLMCRAVIRREKIKHLSVNEFKQKTNDACNKLISNKADNENTNIALAEYYLNIGEFNFAESFLSKVDQDSFDWYLLKSKINYQKGNLSAAADTINQANELFGIYNIALQTKLGLVEFEQGNLVESKKIYEQILAHDSSIFIAKKNLAVILFHLGDLVASNRYFSEINISTPSASTLMNQGTALYFLGRFDDAARAFEQALSLSPSDYLIVGNYADTLLEIDEKAASANQFYNEAIALAGQLLINGNEDDFVILDLAHFHSQLNEFTQADDYFEQFNNKVPDSDLYYYYKAVSYARRGETDAAHNYVVLALNKGYPKQYIESTPILRSLLNI